MRTPARVALGFFLSVVSLVAPAALGDNDVTATKSVSGSFVQGTNVTYTVVLTNDMAVTQPDNPGTEFRDPMPSGLMFVSASASSGTTHYLTTIDSVAWDGSIPAGGSVTLTIVATINPAATGMISNQGQTFFDADGNGSNESSRLSDDPSTATAADATSFLVLQSGIVSATKSVSGTFVSGTDVTYTIVMTNNMTVTQGDNDSHEFTDSLPDNLTLVSIDATSGTISSAGSGVLWDGSLAAGESVTITIVATISPIVTGEISNQGQTVFDRDGDGQNESSQVTDDPSTEAAYDATSFNAGHAGAFEFSASNYDVSESAASFDVTVNRTGGSTGAAEVNYSIAAGTAQGEDFVGGTFGLSFADGETSKTFNVTIVDDAIDEPDQTIALSLSDPTNGTSLGEQSTATITIQDDDAPPTLSIDDVTLTEGDSGAQVATFTITKSGETEFNVTVEANPLLVSGTATCCGPSNDWGGPITGMTFFPATTTRTAQLTVFGDLAYEGDETVIMTLVNAVNATISDETGVLTIHDNDPVPANTYTATKTVSGSFFSGSTVTYTVVLSNNAPFTMPDNPGDEFNDALPASLTLVSADATSGTAAADTETNTVTWNGSIASGESVTLTITAAISATSGTISNQGTSYVDFDNNGTNETNVLTDQASFNVIDSGIVTSTMSVSGSFVQGTDVTYTVVMTNNMSVTQPDNFGHEWTDIFPAGLTPVSVSASSGTIAICCGNSIVFWDGSMASGESVTLTIVATIGATASGTLSNQGQTIFDRDGDGQNESEQQTDDPSTAASYDATSFNVIQSGIVTSTMSVSGTFVQGTNVTYTVVMTNNMTVTQPDNFGHEWTDNLPSGLTLVSVSATSGTTGKVANIAFWDGSLASGASATLTIVATIGSTASGTISNQGQAIFDRNGDSQNESSQVTDDPSTAASYDATSFNVIQSGIVTSTMSVSGTFVQGTEVTYTVVMTNNMSVTQPDNFGHEWTDILPSGLTLVSVSATSGTTGKVSNIAFWDGSLASGASATLTIVATIGSTANGTISNQGQTIFDRDGDGQNESEQVTDDPSTAASYDATSFNVIQSGIVTSTMSVSGTFVQGTSVTYTVVMTNNMTVTQPDNFGHEWTDILPSGLTPVSVSASSGTIAICCGNSIVFWDGSLASGASVTLTIVATIGSTASGTISNQGQTIFDRNGDGQNESEQVTDDPSTAASYDATSFNVIQSGIVTSTMSVSGTFVQGTNVTYTVVMTNNMSVTQPDNFGHEWTDNLPSGLTLVSVSATSGTTGKVSNIAFWDGSIASGASVTLTIVATIGSTASGTISNQGQTIFDRNGDNQNESSQVTDDPSTAASYDATSFTVIAYQADLSLTMSYAPSVPGPSDNITYTLVVSNSGPLTATNVVVTDDRPNDATFQSVSTTQGSCTTADPVVCSMGSLANGASATITLVVKAPSSYDPLTNSATATSDLPDTTPASASAAITCTKSNGKPCKK